MKPRDADTAETLMVPLPRGFMPLMPSVMRYLRGYEIFAFWQEPQTNRVAFASGIDLKGSPIEGQSFGIRMEYSHNSFLFLGA